MGKERERLSGTHRWIRSSSFARPPPPSRPPHGLWGGRGGGGARPPGACRQSGVTLRCGRGGERPPLPPLGSAGKGSAGYRGDLSAPGPGWEHPLRIPWTTPALNTPPPVQVGVRTEPNQAVAAAGGTWSWELRDNNNINKYYCYGSSDIWGVLVRVEHNNNNGA